MRIDDGPADGQAQTEPVLLRGHERLEDSVHCFTDDARATIRYGEVQDVALVGRGNGEAAIRGRGFSHRVARVDDQVQHHLLELDAIGHDFGDVRTEACRYRHATLDQVTVRQ